MGIKLLVMGPLPPPLTGTPISFEILCNELEQRPEIERLDIVDSSPRHLKQQADGSSLTSLADIRQAFRVLGGFFRNIARVDHVVIFGSNGSIATIVPVLLGVCRLLRKPCTFRVFGGSLDWYLSQISDRRRRIASWSLRNLDKIIVQTELLRHHLQDELDVPPDRIGVLPGYRFLPEGTFDSPRSPSGTELKLAFFGIVKPEKGIVTLLDAMAMAEEAGLSGISCDIHGSVPDDFEDEFKRRLSSLSTVEYKGLVGWEEVVGRLRHYDALVLPSSYIGEGHPGVIIEAMLAGITVVSSNFRSIPELVDDEVNGLLVTPEDAEELFRAFERLRNDNNLLGSLCRQNWKRREDHLSASAATRLINMLQSPSELVAPGPITSVDS